MFVGHLAAGLAARRLAPRTGLGWLVGAAVGVDLVWPVLVLLGVERVRIEPGATAVNALVFEAYPWSHSLVMGIAWGALLALLAGWRGADRRAALLVGALVLSHWVLDAVSHVPDMPLWPGASPLVGLGLWNSVAGTLAVEGTLWVAGIWIYLRARPLEGRGPSLAFWSFVGVCSLLWVAGPWSPPPPSAEAVAGVGGVLGWLLIPWAAAADRRPWTPGSPGAPAPSTARAR